MSRTNKRIIAPPSRIIIIIKSLLVLFLQRLHVALSLTTTPPNNHAPINNLFIFGYGSVSKSFISHATEAPAVEPHNHHLLFDNIYVTSRSPPITTTGDVTSSQHPTITILSFDDLTSVERALKSCTHILITVPPQTTTTPSSSSLQCPVLSRYHHHMISSTLRWIGYLSTTGVYGHHEGRWVDETSTTITTSSSRSKAQSYISTEREWMTATTASIITARDEGIVPPDYHLSLCVFRCAGLYGNERSSLHTARRRRAVGLIAADDDEDKKEECYTSRIHVSDVARAIGGSMMLSSRRMRHSSSNDVGTTEEESGGGGVSVDIYNLADDEPEKRSVVMAFAKTLLQPFLTRDDDDSGRESDNEGVVTSNYGRRRQSGTLSERERRRQSENKRVSNTKMKMLLLDGTLMYPTYREGLLSVFETSDDFKDMREQ